MTGETLYHHNIWTHQSAADGTHYEVPKDFRRNTRRDYVPFIIVDKEGELHHADYIQVIMHRDPLVLAIREGDPHLYGSALHATLYYDGEEYRPHYDRWSLSTLERHHQDYRKINAAITELGDWTLTVEVARFHNIMQTDEQLEWELEWVLKEKHNIGMAKERCIIRLKQANALGHIENLEAEASMTV